MARNPTNPVDPTPDEAKPTEVDPTTTLQPDQPGMTEEEYLKALGKIPGGVFYDTPADVDGALDPGEDVRQFSDLSIDERATMLKKFEAKRRQRQEQTVELSPEDALKLKDQVEAQGD